MKAQGLVLNGTLGTIKGTYTDGTLFLGKVLVVDGKAILMSEPDVSFFVVLTQQFVRKEPVPSLCDCVSAVVTLNSKDSTH